MITSTFVVALLALVLGGTALVGVIVLAARIED